MGVADLMNMNRQMDDMNPCTRPGIKSGQVKNVVVNYLRAHPEKRQASAAALAVLAIGEAWCPTE